MCCAKAPTKQIQPSTSRTDERKKCRTSAVRIWAGRVAVVHILATVHEAHVAAIYYIFVLATHIHICLKCESHSQESYCALPTQLFIMCPSGQTCRTRLHQDHDCVCSTSKACRAASLTASTLPIHSGCLKPASHHYARSKLPALLNLRMPACKPGQWV
jgi:hypothetical protein